MSALSVAFALVFLLATRVLAAPTGVREFLVDSEMTPTSWLDIMIKRRQGGEGGDDDGDGYVNDPAAGSYMDTTAIIAVVAGALGVMVLLVLLVICGRAERWPRFGRGGSSRK